ncbi:MAG: dienelactone hydrolase family protein [Tepidisphaeraceae bacterium]
MPRVAPSVFFICMIPSLSSAKIVSEQINYQQAGTPLQGYLTYDDSSTAKRPGIIIFPEWWGLTDYPKHRAEQLASLGYVAFAADMYGSGATTSDPTQAGAMSGKVYKDLDTMRARGQAAMDVLKNDPHVDPDKIAAIGYCFGGACALELARSGADLAAVVSFHGSLNTARPDDAKNIKAKILVCTGGDDAFVPPAQIEAFEDEMRKGGVDWQVNVYSGAHHAFTNPDADKFGIPNIAYNAQADRRSWAAMRAFFDEVLGPVGTK